MTDGSKVFSVFHHIKWVFWGCELLNSDWIITNRHDTHTCVCVIRSRSLPWPMVVGITHLWKKRKRGNKTKNCPCLILVELVFLSFRSCFLYYTHLVYEIFCTGKKNCCGVFYYCWKRSASLKVRFLRHIVSPHVVRRKKWKEGNSSCFSSVGSFHFLAQPFNFRSHRIDQKTLFLYLCSWIFPF